MHYFTLCTTYLQFALPYFALCAMGIIFSCVIKTGKICIFCFKLALNFVMLSAGLIWRCTALIKFSALANLAVIWQNVHWCVNRKKARIASILGKKCALLHNKCTVTLVRKTCKNLAVILYSQYMINVQNSIQILYLVLPDSRLICRNIQ